MTASATSNSFGKLSGRSRAVVLFCGIHAFITTVLFAASYAGLANVPWVRLSLLVCYLGNVALLYRNWQHVKQEPPSPVVPRRIRLHLLLLRASRGTIFLCLLTAIPVALYFATQASRTSTPILLTVLLCPAILGIKLRWLTSWQRRLTRRAREVEAV